MMKEKEFEELLSVYGHDLAQWPQDKQAAAQAFAGTPKGKKLLDAEQQLFSLFHMDEANGMHLSESHNMNAFVTRLEAIPETYAQEEKAKGLLKRARVFLAAFDIYISPVALASQGVALLLLLGVGVMVGYQNAGMPTEETSTEMVDISSSWFGSIDNLTENTPRIEGEADG